MTKNQKYHFIYGFFIDGELIMQLGQPMFCTHKHACAFSLLWETLLKKAYEKLPEGAYIAYDYLYPDPKIPSEVQHKKALDEKVKEWQEFFKTAEYYLNRINAGLDQHKKHHYIEKYGLAPYVKGVYS